MISMLRSLRMSPMCRLPACSIRNHYTCRAIHYALLIPVLDARLAARASSN